MNADYRIHPQELALKSAGSGARNLTKSDRKDDRHDARTLARLTRIDPELLEPVQHRSARPQIHLTVIRARAELVRVNAARGLVRSYGERLPKSGTQQVSRELGAGLSAELRDVLVPISRAGSNGRCNTIWYKAVFKGGVYETRKTVWFFGGAE
jgi:hypothetical protein